MIDRVDHSPRVTPAGSISMAAQAALAAALQALGEPYASEMAESVGLDGNQASRVAEESQW